MPDHDDPLPGLRDVDVRPLPAAEVRARGDRLRRRRTTLTVLGAAASVALVAGVVGVVTSPGGQVQPSPAPAITSPSPTTSQAAAAGQIPDDFPLTAGVPEHEGLVVEHDLGASIAVCDHEVPSGPVLDVMRAQVERPRTEERALQVYGSGADARAEVDDARAAVRTADCLAGRRDFRPVPYTAGESSFAFTDASGNLVRLVTVGRALLFVVTVGGRAAGMVDADPLLQPVIEAMTVFSDEEALPPSAADIPADFPLDLDQVAMEGDGGEKLGPSPDETGLRDLELCGASVWTTSTGRLASTATGPEYADVRELRVYVSADEAAEQLTSLRDQLSGCLSELTEVRTIVDADTGYDSLTWTETYTEGLGGYVVQVTRVGRAVVGIARSGEYSPETVASGVPPLTRLTRRIAAEMCVFTEDGC